MSIKTYLISGIKKDSTESSTATTPGTSVNTIKSSPDTPTNITNQKPTTSRSTRPALHRGTSAHLQVITYIKKRRIASNKLKCTGFRTRHLQ